MNEKVLVTNIQRFSLHDGPGIRTTIFFKGCSLHCPWCCNPENISPVQQKYIKDGKKGIYGQDMSLQEIYNEVMKDKIYYEDDGGVTFSGGEPLLQAKKIIPLWKRLHNEEIHQCIETSLSCSMENVKLSLPYIDLYYVDVKLLVPEIAKRYLGLDLNIYKKNVEILLENQKKVIFRIPFICNYTDTSDNKKEIIHFIKNNIPDSVEILKGHNLGESKYKSLNIDYKKFEIPQESDLRSLSDAINDLGISVMIRNI